MTRDHDAEHEPGRLRNDGCDRCARDAGIDAKIVRQRTLVFAAALRGVTEQILHRRFRLAPKQANSEVAEICRMLIKGLR